MPQEEKEIVLVLTKSEYLKLQRIDPGVKEWLLAGTKLMQQINALVDRFGAMVGHRQEEE